MPGLVGEMGVGGHAVDLDAELLEGGVIVGEVFQLGGAHEGEVGGVEENNRPLAVQIGVADVNELAVLQGARLEGLDGGVDEGHGILRFCGANNKPPQSGRPQTNVQVRLPPGVMGLRLLFEDNQVLPLIINPVKWENSIISIGNSDGIHGLCNKRPMIRKDRVPLPSQPLAFARDRQYRHQPEGRAFNPVLWSTER